CFLISDRHFLHTADPKFFSFLFLFLLLLRFCPGGPMKEQKTVSANESLLDQHGTGECLHSNVFCTRDRHKNWSNQMDPLYSRKLRSLSIPALLRNTEEILLQIYSQSL